MATPTDIPAGEQKSRDVIAATLGDVHAFFRDQVLRLSSAGIDVSGYPLGHLAYRTRDREEYRNARASLEAVCAANVEDVWHDRPISKLLLRHELPLGDHRLSLIELIPPPHRPQYGLGLEHCGFVLGDDFGAFARRHASILTGQQDQGLYNQPLFIAFDNKRLVKFHRHSLQDVVVMEGYAFDGFYHAEDESAEGG